MWLMNTSTFELQEFLSPAAVDGRYAILSHVWNKDPAKPKEQTFEEVQEILKRCNQEDPRVQPSTMPEQHLSEKIRQTCKLAASYGYNWIWNDTCCINKSSSAELSEAINSMFQYYAMSGVCLVYLADVQSRNAITVSPVWKTTPFHRSAWHTRGWTLQELIAPRTVLFFSQDWFLLGAKVDLAPELEVATDIPSSVLALERPLGDFSVAQRMSWASRRETTRVEDQAYSLLGLFDISMPILYGERGNAFLRLQEEIMRRSADTTLFAWGGTQPDDVVSSWLSPAGNGSHLFAPWPRSFEGSGETMYTDQVQKYHQGPSAEQAYEYSLPQLDHWEKITCTRTPDGILAHVPVLELSRATGLHIADLSWSRGRSPIFLILWRDRTQTNTVSAPPSAFSVGAIASSDDLSGHGSVLWARKSSRDGWATERDVRTATLYQCVLNRTESLGSPLEGPGTTWRWMDVYLLHGPAQDQATIIPLNHSYFAPFQFPEMKINVLGEGYGLKIGAIVSISNATIPWTGFPPATFTFPCSRMSNKSAPSEAGDSEEGHVVVIECKRYDYRRGCTATIRGDPVAPILLWTPRSGMALLAEVLLRKHGSLQISSRPVVLSRHFVFE